MSLADKPVEASKGAFSCGRSRRLQKLISTRSDVVPSEALSPNVSPSVNNIQKKESDDADKFPTTESSNPKDKSHDVKLKPSPPYRLAPVDCSEARFFPLSPKSPTAPKLVSFQASAPSRPRTSKDATMMQAAQLCHFQACVSSAI